MGLVRLLDDFVGDFLRHRAKAHLGVEAHVSGTDGLGVDLLELIHHLPLSQRLDRSQIR